MNSHVVDCNAHELTDCNTIYQATFLMYSLVANNIFRMYVDMQVGSTSRWITRIHLPDGSNSKSECNDQHTANNVIKNVQFTI